MEEETKKTKKQKVIRITALIIILLFLGYMTFTFCWLWYSCKHVREELEWGDFIYFKYGNDLYINGFSEQGKQKENIVIPTEINGDKVNILGASRGLGWPGSSFESENLKRLYIPNTIEYVYELNLNLKQPDIKIFFGWYDTILNDYRRVSINRFIWGDIYINDYLKFGIEKYNEYSLSQGYSEFCNGKEFNLANVVYYIYDESGVHPFFVDDVDGTKVNVVPSNPISPTEKVKFSGWYKDPKYQTKWDFEKDIVPAKEYDEEGNYIYKETKLYGFWQNKD